MRLRSICVLAAAATAACACAPREELALRVEYAHCRLDAGEAPCALWPDRRLLLWVEAPGAEIEIDPEDLAAPAAPPVAVQGGHRYEVEVAPDATSVRVHARTDGAERSWRLEVRADESDVLAPARVALDAGEFDAARAAVEGVLASAGDATRAAALGLLARIALGAGDREEAKRHMRAAVAEHAARGDGTALVYLLLQDWSFAEARSVLDGLAPSADAPAETRYLTAYYRGMLARYTGDAREALRQYEAAVAQAERIGLAEWQRSVEDQLATQLQALGRRAEADAIYARLLREAPEDMSDCERARLLGNAGWSRLLALEANEPVDDPAPLLKEALATYERGCASRVEKLVKAHLNLALAALHAGDASAAAAELAAAAPERAAADIELQLWWRDLEGRVDLAQDRPEQALAAYAQLEREATASAAPEAQWRAAVGRAQASAALGARDDALAAFARADEIVDSESLQVPMQEGRETFMASREHATREHVALLLAAGRDGDALEVVRNARSRALRALYRQDRLAQLSGAERARWDAAIARYLEERDVLNASAAEDWHRPADELRMLEAQRAGTREALARALDDAFLVLDRSGTGTPVLPASAPGELMLAYHPLPAGWAAFAHTEVSTRAVELECVDAADGPAALAGCLLDPFSVEIGGAERIRVLPYGVLRNVDFHALPFAGDVLLAAAPVVYGLDLPATPDARGRGDQALVVADPRGNLPAARREAQIVTAALEAGREWKPAMLSGRSAAGSELRRRLAEVDLFHYAGHAVFGGEGGWESVLPLAESSDLTLGDILALAHAPRWVVLSGCETARSGDAAPAESLGLAQAFIAAGSASVLAAARPVADQTAASLVDAFYRAWSGTTPASTALRTAQLALRAQDPAADWASFRIVEH
jgi:tetratricopeptide (TPR) repeat protein